MELRVLGAHNLESEGTRMESHLIDGVLALDAGSLTRSLSFEEQKQIRAIILSHRHFDHVRDLLPLGLAVRDTGVTIELYAIQDAVDVISSRLMDGYLYPDFINAPSPENPTFRFNVVQFHQEFKVLDYTAMAIPMPHSVPAAGYLLSSENVKLFYTGDTGKGLGDAWKYAQPDVLLTEVTFGSENEARALDAGHLTPTMLDEALANFKLEQGHLPRVIVAHMNPPWEDTIRRELAALSSRLGIDILVSHADMTIEL